jgi:hypothetical protein
MKSTSLSNGIIITIIIIIAIALVITTTATTTTYAQTTTTTMDEQIPKNPHDERIMMWRKIAYGS